MKQLFAILSLSVFFVSGCGEKSLESSGRFDLRNQSAPVPAFSADSAYAFIQSQVDFGPRNPGSEGHQLARAWLLSKMRSYAGRNNVFAQNFDFVGYNNAEYRMTNIISAFNTSSTTRILLAAHWDTRPRAEEDRNPARRNEPILGADDGGSGVGVLLELARIFEANPPPVGVDIIFFDGEDYGHSSDLSNYFLGARHWAANPPVPGYSPRFGILLDMVGAHDATFLREGYSLRFAPALVENVWSVAAELGYERFFVNRRGGLVADDHLIVNTEAGIPMINIINYSSDGRSVRFVPHWHTHDDTMDVISTETLQAVGNLMVEIIYNRIPPTPLN